MDIEQPTVIIHHARTGRMNRGCPSSYEPYEQVLHADCHVMPGCPGFCRGPAHADENRGEAPARGDGMARPYNHYCPPRDQFKRGCGADLLDNYRLWHARRPGACDSTDRSSRRGLRLVPLRAQREKRAAVDERRVSRGETFYAHFAKSSGAESVVLRSAK